MTMLTIRMRTAQVVAVSIALALVAIAYSLVLTLSCARVFEIEQGHIFFEATTTSSTLDDKDGKNESATASSRHNVTATTPHNTTSESAAHVSNNDSSIAKFGLYPLNDKTVSWSPTVQREWLSRDLATRPPAQILFTDYGWNHVNQTLGLNYYRSIRHTGLIRGILNHPWFRPKGWESRLWEDTTVRTYVFMDVETCLEPNWPVYGNGTLPNQDTTGNRTTRQHIWRERSYCRDIPKALDALKNSNTTRLVLFDCDAFGPINCLVKEGRHKSISVVSISANTSQHTEYDMGQPPPAVNPIVLTKTQVEDIETCNETSRPFLMTFAGNFRARTRRELKKLHNGDNILIGSLEEINKGRSEPLTYDVLMSSAKFAAAPRGDNLFSYRFTEVMSAGAIPVVYSDNLVLPFSKELIDWSECAVVIPEANVNETVGILSKISAAQRCKMRKCVLDVYEKYMKTPEGTIAGIIETLERKANKINGV